MQIQKTVKKMNTKKLILARYFIQKKVQKVSNFDFEETVEKQL